MSMIEAHTYGNKFREAPGYALSLVELAILWIRGILLT